MPAEPEVPVVLPPKATFIFTLMPDADGEPPQIVEATSLASMLEEMYIRMKKVGSGWIYPVINGERALISVPRQLFKLKLADNSLLDVCDNTALAFDANGRFTVLKERS